MSKIRYCSLEEAWGEIPTPINTKQSLEEETRANLPAANVNFNCQKEPMTSKHGSNIPNRPSPSEPISSSIVTRHHEQKSINDMKSNLEPQSKSLINTMDHLQVKYGITKNDYNTLLEQFSNVIDNFNKTDISKEDFSNQYAPYQNNQNNQSYDILFLILLGLFIIYVLDKR